MMQKDFNGYLVYDDGRIFSKKRKIYLRHDIVRGGYHQVSLSTNGTQKRYKVHRLVAYCFCNPPDNYQELAVDHLDGNKDNNSFDNLEWVTMDENNRRARENKLNDISYNNSVRWNDEDFRKNTGRNISIGRTLSGCARGKNNPTYRYEIFDGKGNEYMLSELADLIGLTYAGTYRLVRRYFKGISNKYFEEFGITINDVKNKVNRLSKTPA
jgi:hypothetical protein